MGSTPIFSEAGALVQELPKPRAKQHGSIPDPLTLHSPQLSEAVTQRQAEVFYLQKQIQAQTSMTVVLEDGSHLHGIIEWYDRNTIKLRGRTRTLVYKSAIKYMYKQGEHTRA